MDKRELERSVADLEAHQAVLENENVSATSKLSKTLKSIEEAEKELESLKSEETKIVESIEGEKESLRKEERRIDQRKTRFENEKKNYQDDIAELKRQEKDQTKKLNKLNQYILTAEETFRELQEKEAEMNEVLAQKEKLVDKILALKDDISALEKDRDRVRLEKDTLTSQKKTELTRFGEKIDVAKEEYTGLEQKIQEANDERDRIHKEASKLKNNARIIYDRLEKLWKKMHPDLKMPLERI